VIVGSEKEKYECAIGTSVLLTLLFAYDGVIMGLPHLNFWKYLVLPHVVLAVATLAFVWKRGVFNDYPVGYIIGFTAILALAMNHQQSFLHSKNDWRGNPPNLTISCIGMQLLLSTINTRHDKFSKILTIDAGTNITRTEIWSAFTLAMQDYWQTLVNYTNQIAP
jgi:hypothetical protein